MMRGFGFGTLERLENLHQLGVYVLVAADDIAAAQRIVVAFDARYHAAGLAHQNLSGRDVPGREVAFPITVEPAGGDEGQVERGGTEAAEAGDLVLQRGHLLQREFVIAATDMRQPAG